MTNPLLPRDLRQRYGPCAVVTGASDGIGRAFARHLAAGGFDLVLAARRADPLRALASELQAAHGIQARILPIDLARGGASRELAAACADLEVGLLVAAAGYGLGGAFLRADLDDEARMVDLNCRCSMELAMLFGRQMAQRQRGGIVLFGSIVGWQGVPGSANYAATKAYVQSLAEGLHWELKPQGVDVLSVAPGPVASGFARRAGMRFGATVDVDTVALQGLRALGSSVTCKPGALSWWLSAALAPLPRSLRVRAMARVMAGMVG